MGLKFLHKTAKLKLCDFGLAEIFDKKSGFQSNKYCGKPNYKSPEISEQKKSFNAKSNDIWCLGVCLFMMIIGSSPWKISNDNDGRFSLIIAGNIEQLITSWN